MRKDQEILFKRLLELYLHGNITAEQQDQFFDLVSSGSYDHILVTQLDIDLNSIDATNSPRLAPHYSEEIVRGILNAERQTAQLIPIQSKKNWYGWAAAIAGILLIGGYLMMRHLPDQKDQLAQNSSNTVIKSNSTDTIQELQLEDGSTVALHPNSTLYYPQHFSDSSREVSLEGEAFFTVSRNPDKPFLVFGERIVARVLGTSFTVNTRANDGEEEVSVRTGRVQVSGNKGPNRDAEGASPVIVTPNQRAIFQPQKGIIETTIVPAPQPLLPETTDKSTVVKIDQKPEQEVYEHIKLLTLFDSLERNYGIEILLENEKLGNCVFTGDITGENLFSKLQIICLTTNSSYEINGTRILITGQGCN